MIMILPVPVFGGDFPPEMGCFDLQGGPTANRDKIDFYVEQNVLGFSKPKLPKVHESSRMLIVEALVGYDVTANLV